MAGELTTRKISREQLERIMQRAAELQAGELDTGEDLTEQDLLKLGAEVGIPGRFQRQALYEEAAGSAALERSPLSRLFGPKMVLAHRVVPGERAALERVLAAYMTDEEAMTPKRRLPDRTVWERQKGLLAEMKRGLSLEGKAYQLARAAEVSVQLTALEEGYCHTELAADVSNLREAALAGAGTLASTGVLVAAVLLVVPGLGVLAPLPLVIGLGLGLLAGGSHRRKAARVQLALEQVLDGLESGGIRSAQRLAAGPRASAIARIASEIKKSVTDMAQTLREPPGPPPARPPSDSTSPPRTSGHP